MSNGIDNEGHQHLDTENARAGESKGVMRYVLGISLALVVVIFAVLLFVRGG